MDPERWKRIEVALDGALELAAPDRAAYLDAACGGDALLRDEVEGLLRAGDAPDGFLDRPATEFAAPFLAALTGTAEALAPARIGAYRVVREIGRGGMGIVYLAERDDDQYRKQVALKVVRRGPDADDHLVRRFIEERQILASLDHPNIARLLDGGLTADGLPFFAMEYVDGTPIDRYCDERRLPVDDRLALFRSVCDAVGYAHRNLVVHRDLKPSNILVTADGAEKLLDFGIAKLLAPAGTEPSAVTRTGAGLMTPAWASPEQLLGESVSTSSDVWSLGAVLYALLTGGRPFDPAAAPAHRERLMPETEPARPSVVVRGRPAAGEARGTTADRLARRLAGDLDTIVLTALRREPARRYGGAEALGEDVRRHTQRLPIAARPDTARYRTRMFVRRHRAGVAAGAAALLLLIAATIVTGVQAARIAAEHDQAERVATLLVDLFAVSDPDISRGRAVTARELLDRGAERIGRELADQPGLRAPMLTAMGRAYVGLGLYAEARPLLESAVAAHRKVHGAESAEAAAALFNLAYLAQAAGSSDSAEALFRESLAIRRGLHGARHRDVVASLNGVAFVLRDRGDFAGSAALYRDALAAGRALSTGNDSLVATTLGGLAEALTGLRDYAVAEPLFREALAMNRAMLGNDHPHININLYSLAKLLHDKGDLAAAEPLYREAVAVGLAVFGDRHPMHALDLVGLAGVLRDKGDYAESIALHRRALAIQRSALPAGHPRIARTLLGLGRVLTEAGMPAEAEEPLREALAARRSALKAGHWQIAEAGSALGAALSAVGQGRVAESLLIDGYTTLRAERGDADAGARRARRQLAEHYGRSGDAVRAAAYRADTGDTR